HKRLPAAAIRSKEGKPLLSWRVAILPYVGHKELYEKFKLDEPWDSEHNKKLLAEMPKIYAPVGVRAQAGQNETFYRVFEGSGTPFEGKEGLRFEDFTNKLSKTILVVEAGDAVLWTKPDELPYDPEKPLPAVGGMFENIFHVVLADGMVFTV